MSASIQAQTASFQQNYDELIRFLKTTYGKIEVISGGLLTELEKRKKPADTDYQERAESLLAIANVILRIRNLKTKLQEEQVTTEITSYNFLHRIRNLLSTVDYMELTKDFIDNELDARVAAGDKALELTLGRIRKTIALLEPMVEKLRAKPKPRSLHTIDTVEESHHSVPHMEAEVDSRYRSLDNLYKFDTWLAKSGKWWDQNLKFPCPIEAHRHELFQCPSFMGMSPKERHEKLKGRICRTYLKPGGVCMKGKKCGSKVPKGLFVRVALSMCKGGTCPPTTTCTAPAIDPTTPTHRS